MLDLAIDLGFDLFSFFETDNIRHLILSMGCGRTERAQWPDSVICRELVIAALSIRVALASAGRERFHRSRPVRSPCA
jgi:hypothetical protein